MNKRKKLDWNKVLRIFNSVILNRFVISDMKSSLEKAGIYAPTTAVTKNILISGLVANWIITFFLIERTIRYGIIVPYILICLVFIVVISGILFFIPYYKKSKQEDFEAILTVENFPIWILRSGIVFSLIGVILLHKKIIGTYLIFSILLSLIGWVLYFLLLLLFIWILFFVYLDFRMYQRKVEIENVFPDFLQLTSANISAGMPIDRALWFAVRPRFGVLAKEVEDVAKSTLVGEKLDDALIKFANKYDSLILQRSINLLLEGLESGGRVGDLLNRIANNISESRIIRKEMASNVTTYVIFIGFATLCAAPFLFGLSTQLVIIMTKIMTNITIDGGSVQGMKSMFSLEPPKIKISDYRIFTYSMMSVTSLFSAVIISIIKNGNVRAGIHYIPIFIGSSLVVYTIASWLMGSLLGGFF